MQTKRPLTLLVLLIVITSAAACGGGGSNPPGDGGMGVTFWQDVAPIYNAKCVRCHQEGGIGPFRLDNYADAKTHAAAELARSTTARCRRTSWFTTTVAAPLKTPRR